MVFKKSISVKNSEIGPVYAYDWEIKPIKDIVAVNESNLNSASDCKIIEYIDINSVEHGIINERTTMYLKDAPTRARRILKEGDVLISTVRPNLKHYCIIRNEVHCTIASTGFAVLTSKNVDPAFLFYSITTETFTNYLSAIAETSTTAYPSITASVISESKIPYPRITEQKAIANILSSLDSKIELNQQMNKTLESIAQTLFKHWFIDFEFPDEDGQPYKSSGGEMADSEFGGIPKGWKYAHLKDILSTLESGSRPKGGATSIGVPSIGAENIIGLGHYEYASTKYVPTDFYKNMKSGKVQDFDVLLYKDGAQIGRKSMFALGFPFEEFCVNEHVFILRSSEILNQYYLYFWLDLPYITETITNLNANSAQPGINKQGVGSIPILIPNKAVIEKFGNLVNPFIKSIFLNSKESKKIAEIRDLLLPKLVTGKIRVPLEDTNV